MSLIKKYQWCFGMLMIGDHAELSKSLTDFLPTVTLNRKVAKKFAARNFSELSVVMGLIK